MQLQPTSVIEDDINALTGRLADLGAFVESMMGDVVDIIQKPNADLARDIIGRDVRTNAMRADIDTRVESLLAGNALSETVIRRLMSAVKIASELERIGDLTVGVARRISHMPIDTSAPQGTNGLMRMGRQVRSQIAVALDALVTENTPDAVQVWISDDDIDALYNSLFREFLTYMMEDPRVMSTYIDLLFAAKNFERIGDHAINVCAAVYYSVKGTQLQQDLTLVKHLPR